MFIVLGGVYGFLSVALGAFGAHALKGRLMEAGTLDVWRTAAHYAIIHAVALTSLGWGMYAKRLPGALGAWAGAAWSVGVLLFSGSLFGLALEGPRWLGPITPLGGLLFMTGWLILLVSGVKLLKQE